jgi:hypothetical protein
MLSIRESNRGQAPGGGATGAPVRVAVALPQTSDQLEQLQEALGPEFVVEDIRRAPADAEVVMVPPCSPGAIRAILRDFPVAHVVVVEGEGSPVERAFFAGASDYLRHTTARQLADSVRWTLGRIA